MTNEIDLIELTIAAIKDEAKEIGSWEDEMEIFQWLFNLRVGRIDFTLSDESIGFIVRTLAKSDIVEYLDCIHLILEKSLVKVENGEIKG